LNNFKELLGKGKNHYREGKYLKSLEFYSQALKLANKHNLTKKSCKITINKAGALYRLTRFKEAEDFYQKALEIALDHGFKKQECEIYNYFGTLYEAFNEYEKAEAYIDKGLEIAKELNDDSSTAKLLNSKGTFLQIFGNYEDALKNYNEAMKYYQSSNNVRGIGATNNLIAGYCYKIKEFDLALNFYKKAKEIGKNLPDFEMMAIPICRTGNIYSIQNDKNKVLDVLPELNFLEEKSQNKKIIIEVHHIKALIYKLLNQKDLATEHFEKAIILADSIELNYLRTILYKDVAIFHLENGKIKKTFNYLMSCVKVFGYIKEKIDNKKYQKNYEDSFQDIIELLWSLSKVIPFIENDDDISEFQHISGIVQDLCKLTNNYSNDYVLKLQTNIMAESIIKKFKNLKTKKGQLEISFTDINEERNKLFQENVKLRGKVNLLKEKIKIFENKFEEIKSNPEIYEGLDEEYLKEFINTEVWSDSKRQLVNNYFLDVFNDLADKSKKELIFMKVIFNIMRNGYEICAFLITKVVERELRLNLFKIFKSYWRTKLKQCYFIKNKKNLSYSKRKTNDCFLDYLSDKILLPLGNISYILKEINEYCEQGNSKSVLLGWEKYFLEAFKNDICSSISIIINALSIKNHSKKSSIKFIELRNLVSHADDVEPEIKIHKEIEFDMTFVINLLENMTIKKPKLLLEICKIKPNS